MALRKWSIIEEELRRTGNIHPMLLKCLGEMHERHRVQHEQMMQVAAAVNTLTDKFTDVVQAAGRLKDIVEKSGLTDKLRELEGDDGETGSTWHDMRDAGKKN